MFPVPRLVLLAALPLAAAMLALVLGFQRDSAIAQECVLAHRVDVMRVANDHERTARHVLIGAFAVVLLGGCLLALSLRDHRVAYRKLQRMARRVVQAQEDERARWSRELHDGTGQMLVGTKLLIESAVRTLERDPERASTLLEQALYRLREVSEEVRRVSHLLRPAALDTLGLAPALRELSERFCTEAQVACRFASRGQAVLPREASTAFFRVAQEALANVGKHAQAREVDVSLDLSPDRIRMKITDDGRGFDVGAVIASPRSGIGLRNMRERLAAVGGRLHIESRPGRTTLTAQMPWKR